jgi:transcription elongation factor Elf1
VESDKLKILENILGFYNKEGNQYLFFCPRCNHHKRKLSVNVGINKFKCWVCDYSGSALRRLVRKYGSFHDRQEWGKFEDVIDLNNFDDLFSDDEEEIEQTVNLPEEFVSLANKDLPLSSLPAKRYLLGRGITKEDFVRWKIGFCGSGEYEGRVVVPSFNDEGYVNYFIGRSYNEHWRKYKNPPISKNIVFNSLYVDWTDDLSLVEGIFDAIVAGPNAIPILGSSLREESKLFQEIVKNDTPVYVALDSDAEKKAMYLIKKLLAYGIELYKVDISPHSDVGEMSKEEYKKRKDEALLMTQESLLLYQAINL